MAKTITIRIDDDTYHMIKTAAEGERRSISNFIEYATIAYLTEENFVSDSEMQEILKDKSLLNSLNKGKKEISVHGNIWEWTNDWYGEYDAADKVNPQGPETGTKKVDRGGGFYDPAWKCRSAYRGGGTPPGNRGSGISFRLVKSKQKTC